MSSGTVATAAQRIAFYDPDANHQAILQITGWFNQYLRSQNLDLEFQPVQQRDAFEKLLKDSKTSYAIVSSAYLKQRSGGLVPLLVPSSAGTAFYRKQLMTKTKHGNAFAGQAIAAAVTGENRGQASKEVLRLLMRGGVRARGASVIPVSKDIDALLALTFGQVQGALVTSNSVNALKRLNPVAAKDLEVVFTTPPILRAPLCIVGGNKNANSSEVRAVLKAIRSMGEHEQGKRALSTLDIETWVPFEKEMLQG